MAVISKLCTGCADRSKLSGEDRAASMVNDRDKQYSSREYVSPNHSTGQKQPTGRRAREQERK